MGWARRSQAVLRAQECTVIPDVEGIGSTQATRIDESVSSTVFSTAEAQGL